MNQDQQLRTAELIALSVDDLPLPRPTKEMVIEHIRNWCPPALTATQHAAPIQGAEELAELIEFLNSLPDTLLSRAAIMEKSKRAAALLEASAQREQPAASKPEPRKRIVDCGECATGCTEGHCRKYPSKPEPQPQATTPKCIGYIDKFGNFKRELPSWMTDEPGVNWREVADLQECTQLHERVAELEQTLAFLTGPKRPLPSVLVHTRLGADVLYDGVSWDKQNANTLHVQVSSAALDAKTNRIIELERELKLKGQP